MTHVHVVGLGMGPHHLTREATALLQRSDFVLAVRKSDDDPLLEVRRAVAAEFGLELIEVVDPERDRDEPADYVGAVRSWHAARVDAFAQALTEHPGTGAFLVWGDPSLYDSTLRILNDLGTRIDLTWDVVPGISAPQILAARHRIVLHEVGAAVHITTARRLREDVEAGQRNLVVMLGSERSIDHVESLADWTLWWGANLGTPSERLVAGTVRDVAAAVRAARQAARDEAGWVMDACLLRAPGSTVPG